MTVTATETEVALTPEKALELLRRARDLKGADYVYPRFTDGRACRYRDEHGQPSCLVGHVFMWAGLTDLPEGPSAFQIAMRNDMGKAVANILDSAQCVQDTAHTWGEAVDTAERVAREHGVTA